MTDPPHLPEDEALEQSGIGWTIEAEHLFNLARGDQPETRGYFKSALKIRDAAIWRERDAALARVKELEEALRHVLDEASMQAHRRGCGAALNSATFERGLKFAGANPNRCSGCEAERLLAAQERSEEKL